MRIIVQKYGGSSLSSTAKIKAVAKKIVDTKRAGYEVVAVVSAMGKTTDDLLTLVEEISPLPPRRELDMLVSVGERISMALMAMAIHELGEEAVSFTGSQCEIITNDAHANAKIVEVRPFRVMDQLARGRIAVVAGFQGMSYRREITTLGRGGSDTTAIALAAALGAEHCDIFSDVDGVYSADPRVVDSAERLLSIGYETMLELARNGARVLNRQAVEFARRSGIALYARGTFQAGEGTRIYRSDGTIEAHRRREEAFSAQSITGRRDLLRIHGLEPLTEAEMMALLSMVSQHPLLSMTWDATDGRCDLLLPTRDIPAPETLLERLKARFPSQLHLELEVGLVAIVGPEVGDHPGAIQRAIHTLTQAGIDVRAIRTARESVSIILPAEVVETAIQHLHQAFIAPTHADAIVPPLDIEGAHP